MNISGILQSKKSNLMLSSTYQIKKYESTQRYL